MQWTGYKFNPKTIQLNQIWMFSIFGGEMKGSNSYSTSSRLVSRKITAQKSTYRWSSDLEYKFIIKDKANTNYSNWNDI